MTTHATSLFSIAVVTASLMTSACTASNTAEEPPVEEESFDEQESALSGAFEGCSLKAFAPQKKVTDDGVFLQAAVRLSCPTPRKSVFKGIVLKDKNNFFDKIIGAYGISKVKTAKVHTMSWRVKCPSDGGDGATYHTKAYVFSSMDDLLNKQHFGSDDSIDVHRNCPK